MTEQLDPTNHLARPKTSEMERRREQGEDHPKPFPKEGTDGERGGSEEEDRMENTKVLGEWIELMVSS